MNLREEVRKAVVAKITSLQATFTAFPLDVEYPNAKAVNTSTQSKPYLKVTVKYQDGLQTTLGNDPGHRLIGMLVLEARAKEGTGQSVQNDILHHFYKPLQMKDTIPPLRTLAAKFTSGDPFEGWVTETAIIPFWVDSIGS